MATKTYVAADGLTPVAESLSVFTISTASSGQRTVRRTKGSTTQKSQDDTIAANTAAIGNKADQTAVDAINADNATQTELDAAMALVADGERLVSWKRETNNNITLTIEIVATNVQRNEVIAAASLSSETDTLALAALAAENAARDTEDATQDALIDLNTAHRNNADLHLPVPAADNKILVSSAGKYVEQDRIIVAPGNLLVHPTGAPTNLTGDDVRAGVYSEQLDAVEGSNNLWGPTDAAGEYPAQADNRTADILLQQDATVTSGAEFTEPRRRSLQHLDAWATSRGFFPRYFDSFAGGAGANGKAIKKNELVVVGKGANRAGAWLCLADANFATNDETNFAQLNRRSRDQGDFTDTADLKTNGPDIALLKDNDFITIGLVFWKFKVANTGAETAFSIKAKGVVNDGDAGRWITADTSAPPGIQSELHTVMANSDQVPRVQFTPSVGGTYKALTSIGYFTSSNYGFLIGTTSGGTDILNGTGSGAGNVGRIERWQLHREWGPFDLVAGTTYHLTFWGGGSSASRDLMVHLVPN